MRRLLSLFLMMFSFGLHAQRDATSYVVVTDIVISGNNVTKDAIIFRELTFGVGDTIPLHQWDEELRISPRKFRYFISTP